MFLLMDVSKVLILGLAKGLKRDHMKTKGLLLPLKVAFQEFAALVEPFEGELRSVWARGGNEMNDDL